MVKGVSARAEGQSAIARPLRLFLYVMTVLSAAAALFLEPALAGAVERGAISPNWLFTAIGIYGLFFTTYAVDRGLLVRARRYPAGKAFFQIAFGLVFGLLLLPSTIGDYTSRRPKGLERLLSHSDPEVRRVTTEALGFRGPTRANAAWVLVRLDDSSEEVQAAALDVLVRWSGRPRSDVAGIRAWAAALSATSSVSNGEGVR